MSHDYSFTSSRYRNDEGCCLVLVLMPMATCGNLEGSKVGLEMYVVAKV